MAAAAVVFVALIFASSCSTAETTKSDWQISDVADLNTTLTPEAEPWPEWVFMPWAWEDESTQSSVIDLVDGYQSRHIPLGAVIIDSPWETGYNTFDPDPSRYPDMTALIETLHSRDVRVILWITGFINTDVQPLYNEAAGRGFFMTDEGSTEPKVISWWKGKGSLIDFFNPEAVAFWEGLMDKAFRMGADGWKVDMSDQYVAQAPYSGYLGRRVSVLEYSRRYYGAIYSHTKRRLGRNGMITARPVDINRKDPGEQAILANSHAPVEAGWAGWVGDQVSTFDPEHYSGIRGALLNYYYSAKLGYLAFGSDIGGYIGIPGRSLDRELLLRWAGLGAFSPIMENGGIAEHRPWAYGDDVALAYKRFAELHVSMIGYLLEHARDRYSLGKSLLEFTDRKSFSYLLGPDIFVQPLTGPCGCADIRLPKTSARWVYLFDRTQVFAGGDSFSASFAVDEFPVYIKEGSPVLDSLVRTLENFDGGRSPASGSGRG
jgi:alpha-glucosidase (family GH31 glycosyl hydrolase)